MLRVNVEVPLRDFELNAEIEVAAGERLALVGPSGAGKSTILRVIAGLVRPRAGRVELTGRVLFDAEQRTDLPPEARRCGYMFQDYALFDHLSAGANVAYGLRGMPRSERRCRAGEMLERFGIGHLAQADPREISGGERQRVALARALAPEPDALLLDEPVSALDSTSRSRALRELDALLAAVDVPTIVVTHDYWEAALLGRRVAVIDRGQIVQEGDAAGIAARPRSAFVADFAGAVVLTGEASRGPDGLTLVELEGGGRLASTDPGEGPVAVSVYPWEIALEPQAATGDDTALNRLPAQVISVTAVANRVRVGLAVPEPVTAEITGRSAGSLGLGEGDRVTAVWKATATRLSAI